MKYHRLGLSDALRYVAHIFLLLSQLAHALDNPSLRYLSIHYFVLFKYELHIIVACAYLVCL